MKELRTEKLVKEYNGRRVVNGVSLEIKQGEIVGLLGPNGAGKTTTFYMVVGLIKPTAGGVYLDNVKINTYPMYKRARLGISYLAQEPSVFRRLNVSDNLNAILEMTIKDKKKRKLRLEELLSDLGIEHIATSMGYALSGGERRRVEIARALILNPNFLLLDEPFAGVDPIAVLDVQDIVRKLKNKGIGVLITDHNVRETLEITDRAYVMFEGKILISGKAEVLVNDPEARRIYLGENFKM